ncbi:MAG: DUF3618 domain-containing protein [Pyrinomonadaceae bacterium]
MPSDKETRASEAPSEELTKAELQARMEKTRENLAESVEELKERVERQYDSVKETVTGVLNYREQFKEEPLVWSLGALSAGFALGYTLGYAHKNIKHRGRNHSQIAEFADTITRQLSTVGEHLVMPALNVQIKELFGFDFSKVLEEMGSTKPSSAKKRTSKKKSTKKRVPKTAGKIRK